MQIESSLSNPSPEGLAAWRAFLESAYALIDIVDSELQEGCGISLRWYDVLVHLEDSDEGLRMNEIASRILASKSGLTRVIDRMEEAGLVHRERPADNRRVVLVSMTPAGVEMMHAARRIHRDSIERHFAQHLDRADCAALTRALRAVGEHVRPLRPGRISS